MTLYVERNGQTPQVSRRELALVEMVAATGRELHIRTDRTIILERGGRSPRRTTPDIYFGGAKVAVFHDGCYWHECPEHHPRSFGGRVAAKMASDGVLLAKRRWLVMRVWEHEPDLQGFADSVVEAVRERRLAPGLE